MILESDLAAIIARQREIEERKSIGQIRSIEFNDALLDSHALPPIECLCIHYKRFSPFCQEESRYPLTFPPSP